ncbi:MAG: CHAT domain-containing protein [Nostoc sp. DedQUE01]
MIDQYIFSGSLPENASTYVTREADDELYEALLQGRFCYVLNSRQSGKSSLRVRTMSRLGEAGVECASIDLSSINIQTATQENWYADLMVKLIDSFVLDLDFQRWWEQNQLNSPLLRFGNFISNILLNEIQENLVIFIDEIDSVLSLNFSTDDFFAFIRSCYNQRVDNPKYNRLTFCLLGVTSPSSLIQDKNRTPFNIGKAISLKGFQLHEVEPLEKGLRGKFSNLQAIIQEILQWTGGQPFLTQKLCQFMVEESEQENPRSVEQVVRSRIIKNWESQDEPEHLRTIQFRILRDEQRAGYLLELYQQIRLSEEQAGVTADDTLEQSELQLSGLVVRQQGNLIIYNQIYREIFDYNWIENQLKNLRPYSENFRFWVASGGNDDSRFLRGKALQEALGWAKDKNLSYQDRQFLAASKEKEIQEEIAAQEQQAALERERKDREAVETINKVLAEANNKAQQRIYIGTVVLISTLLITISLVFIAGKEVLKARNAREEAKQAQQAQREAEQRAKEVEGRVKKATQTIQNVRQKVDLATTKLEKAEIDAKLANQNREAAEGRIKLASQKVALATTKLNKAEIGTKLANQNKEAAEARLEQTHQEIQNLSQLAGLGGELYRTNQISGAEEAWKQTALSLEISDNRLKQAMLLSNISIAYEQVGKLTEANKAVSDSLKLLKSEVDRKHFADRLAILAQAFNTKSRLLEGQGDIQRALFAYTEAFNIIQSFNNDFTNINPAIQVSVQQTIESLYRKELGYLLKDQNTAYNNQQHLKKILQINKLLKIAEINNFFGMAYLDKRYLEDKLKQNEEADPTTAVIYPFILPDQIRVIVKIPKQPLQSYSTKISQTEVEKLLVELRRNLLNPVATRTVETQSQQVYNWLLKPIESKLEKSGVNTLVFVPDGALGNIPMSALYDGKQYLVEKYAVALSVGLQLLDPKPLVEQRLVALTAGLTQPPLEFSQFPQLLGIKSQFEGITKAGVSTTILLDGDFKKKNLESEIAASSFNIVHLATQCQYSSRLKDTFILDFDGQINVKDFDTLFRSQSKTVVELLVLTACQAALGDNHAAIGLAGAAVRAGARSTLASLWQIDDKSTAIFMIFFYRELNNGKITRAEAVNRAQLKLLKHPNYKAPSFWAAYVLCEN